MTVKKIVPLDFLRILTLVLLLVGAGGSLGLMLRNGRNNSSILLIALFGIWVLSPFTALILATVISKRWSVLTRATLYSLILIVTVGSLVGYSGAWSPPGTKPAFVFLIIPLISWFLMAIVMLIARSKSRRLSRGRDQA
ncbi:MAG TPA: hypothetical protein VK543_04405 [Puia sp.]|nr:hypothetical protein [Puia sp.]